MDGWMDGWMGGWMDGWSKSHFKDCLQKSTNLRSILNNNLQTITAYSLNYGEAQALINIGQDDKGTLIVGQAPKSVMMRGQKARKKSQSNR